VLLQATNRLSEAEPLMRRALAIDEQSFGIEHPAVARALNNLAVLLKATNRLSEAEPLMRRALEIWEKSYGAPSVSIQRGGFAFFLQNGLQDYISAKQEYEAAIAALPDDFVNRVNFAGLCLELEDKTEARRQLQAAWKLRPEASDRFTARDLLYRAALAVFSNVDPTRYLAQLKSILKPELVASPKKATSVAKYFERELPENHRHLFQVALTTVFDPTLLPELEVLDDWKAIVPISIDAPWEE